MVLVYTSLCGLIPKYANTAWDATLAMNTMSLKMLQKKTVKLGVGKVSLLMLWTEPATSQKKPKKNHKLGYLMKILQEEERCWSLMMTYDGINRVHQNMRMTSRPAAPGELMSVDTAPHGHQNSFLPRTIRDTKEKTD